MSDEFTIIDKYIAPLVKQAPESMQLTDDAAVIACSDNGKIVITKDAMVAGKHFFPQDKPDMIARKLLRVNLSDLAAMGASPCWYMLAMILPDKTKEYWIKDFFSGLGEDISKFGGQLIGGDTVFHAGEIVATLTALGKIPVQASPLLRSAAEPADSIYVSGTIGDSYLGLQLLNQTLGTHATDEKNFLIERYYIPQPRIALGKKLLGIANAAIDISDGLVADLRHICSASRLGACVYIENIPLSEQAKKTLNRSEENIINLMTGGDDYELLFTVPACKEEELQMLSAQLNIPCTKIGHMTNQVESIEIYDKKRKKITLPSNKEGYQHSIFPEKQKHG